MTAYESEDWGGFLAAIRAKPEDNSARLIAADWLEEMGEAERATFIRDQIRLLRMSGDPSLDGEREETRLRLMAVIGRRPFQKWFGLGAQGRCRWRGAEYDIAAGWELSDCGFRVSVRRGFLTSVRLPTRKWLNRADRLLAREPVEAVRLTDFAAHRHTRRMVIDGVRECRLIGRERRHPIPLTDATHLDYARVFAAEWPGVRFTLPRLHNFWPEAVAFIPGGG